jgi:hypothetical protein
LDWLDDYPKFDGNLSLAIDHVVKFLKYTFEINVIHEDLLIRFFLISLEGRQKNWVKHSLGPKSISSLTIFIEEFLKQWGLRFQSYEDTFSGYCGNPRRRGILF